MPGGLVAVNDLFVDQRVDDRHRFFVGLGGRFPVARLDGGGDPPDGGAHARAQGDVTDAVFIRLTGGFFS